MSTGIYSSYVKFGFGIFGMPWNMKPFKRKYSKSDFDGKKIDFNANTSLTMEECASKIRGVCSGCGRNLSIKSFTLSGEERFCSSCDYCNQIDFGVPEDVFLDAKKMVENGYEPVMQDSYRAYERLGDDDSIKRRKIRATSEMINLSRK